MDFTGQENLDKKAMGQGGNAAANGGRRYLPTLSDLVDRLTIVQQKAIFIHERKAEYLEEMELIKHDIDLIVGGLERKIGAREIHAIIVIMLANRYIWEHEGKARLGCDEQDKFLKITHSINGVRNTAKNVLAEIDGGRHDYKIDALSESLIPEFGNWNIYGKPASPILPSKEER
jgi:hypothetical protein